MKKLLILFIVLLAAGVTLSCAKKEKKSKAETLGVLLVGDNKGWPPASHFQKCKIPALKQPSGTKVTYSYHEGVESRIDHPFLIVYMKGGKRKTFEELVRANGGNAPGPNVTRWNRLLAQLSVRFEYRIWIDLEDDGVVLRVNYVDLDPSYSGG